MHILVRVDRTHGGEIGGYMVMIHKSRSGSEDVKEGENIHFLNDAGGWSNGTIILIPNEADQRKISDALAAPLTT